MQVFVNISNLDKIVWYGASFCEPFSLVDAKKRNEKFEFEFE